MKASLVKKTSETEATPGPLGGGFILSRSRFPLVERKTSVNNNRKRRQGYGQLKAP